MHKTLGWGLFFFVFSLNAQISHTCWMSAEYESLYAKIPVNNKQHLKRRLEQVSRSFLGFPYRFNALGEGEKGRFDQCPLYRLDQFDCETFVTTVLAVTLAHDRTDYERVLRLLRYQEGKVSFLTRNHFTATDWNRQAQSLGILQDITRNLQDETGRPVFAISTTQIDKPNWYSHLPKERIRLLEGTTTLENQRLNELRESGKFQPKLVSEVAYIPLNAFFNSLGQTNLFLVRQIPSGAIIEIIRPNWAIEDKIGTRLDVSHLGFAFWRDGQLWFRNASSKYQKVVDEPLMSYLQAAKRVPSIGGINIQVIRESDH